MAYEPHRPLKRPCLLCQCDPECERCGGEGSYIPVFQRLAGILVEEGVVDVPERWRFWEFEWSDMDRGWVYSVCEGDVVKAILSFRVVPSDHLVWETWCWLSRDPVSDRNEFRGEDFEEVMGRTLGEVRKQSARVWAYFMGHSDPRVPWTERLGTVV